MHTAGKRLGLRARADVREIRQGNGLYNNKRGSHHMAMIYLLGLTLNRRGSHRMAMIYLLGQTLVQHPPLWILPATTRPIFQLASKNMLLEPLDPL